MRLNANVVHAIVGLLNTSETIPTRLSDIAEREPELSRLFLEQVFRPLRLSGLVKSHRGPGGGYTLTRSLNKISLQDVLDVLSHKTVKQRAVSSLMAEVEKNLADRFKVYAQSYTLADMQNRIIPINTSAITQYMEVRS